MNVERTCIVCLFKLQALRERATDNEIAEVLFGGSQHRQGQTGKRLVDEFRIFPVRTITNLQPLELLELPSRLRHWERKHRGEPPDTDVMT